MEVESGIRPAKSGKRKPWAVFYRRMKKKIKMFFAPKWVREYEKFEKKKR